MVLGYELIAQSYDIQIVATLSLVITNSTQSI